MKIGFDTSMTHNQKSGCGMFADRLSHALLKNFPDNEYVFYDHFINWINPKEIQKKNNNLNLKIQYPLNYLTPKDANKYWNRVKKTGNLSEEPDIIHSNNFQACKFTNAKLVYTLYDVSFWVHPNFTTEANRLACQNGVLNAIQYATGIVYISSHARDEFHRILPGAIEKRGIKECIIHLGPAHHILNSTATNENKHYWLQVGSLEPRKNYEATLDALEIYWKKSQLRLPLKIVGGHGWKSQSLLRRIQSLEEVGMVSYLEYVEDSLMPSLYADAMSLIFPSWYEGFGLPILEAMGLGCPVVSSNTASLPEVGGSAVTYIDPTCPEQISAEMLRIEGDPARRESMVQNGIKQAEKFSWSKAASQLIEFYAKVL